MRIALTGATGFIGRHVVAELDRRSISPTLVCRPSSKIPPHLEKFPIALIDLKNPPPNSFEVMGNPDVLIHLAWSGLPNYESLRHYEEELPIQYRFLKGLIESGLKDVVVAGTCFEYGMQSGALSEDVQTQPTNAYGFSKDALRRELEFLQQVIPFNLTWARLFYLYGEGQAASSLLSQLKMAVERGDKVFNLSGGEQLRDYLPVSEAAKCLVSLATQQKNVGIINICSGAPISVRRLVESWLRENESSIELNFGYHTYSENEPMAFWGNRQKLARHI